MPGLTRLDAVDLPDNTPYWIEAFGATRRLGGDDIGTGEVVLWSMAETGATPGGDAYRTVTAAERTNIETSLDRLAAGSGISFQETTDPSQASLLVGATSNPSASVYGRTWQNTHNPVEMVAYDSVYDSPDGLARNGYIYIHEGLHAVGLSHSTRAFGSRLEVVIPDDEDNGTTLFGSWGSGWNGGIQLFDLAAMQYLYGPDTTQRSGDDTYDLGAIAAYDPRNPDRNVPLLWDGGGIDRVDLSAATGAATASLQAGVISQVGTTNTGILEAGTFSINHFSEFEMLIGTGFDDMLTGSDRADSLSGGAGNDTIIGGTGTGDLRDYIIGEGGDDSIDGGYGNDDLNGGAGADTLNGGFGADTVVGNSGDDVLTGAAFGDLISGNDGDDFINGGFGSDRVNGGAGADRFFHLGIADHGSDWIQDYDASQGDTLVFGGAASRDLFQINLASTPGAGDTDIEEAFIIYRPTGQIIWALVDGAAQTDINLVLGGQSFDLTG